MSECRNRQKLAFPHHHLFPLLQCYQMSCRAFSKSIRNYRQGDHKVFIEIYGRSRDGSFDRTFAKEKDDGGGKPVSPVFGTLTSVMLIPLQECLSKGDVLRLGLPHSSLFMHVRLLSFFFVRKKMWQERQRKKGSMDVERKKIGKEIFFVRH